MGGRWSRAPRGDVASDPSTADDGRWGVARLVAEREAERLATERAAARVAGPRSPEAADEPVSPLLPPQRDPNGPVIPPEPRAPMPAAPPRPVLPAPRRPAGRAAARVAMPRVEPDLALLGFSRRTRGRLGSRLFVLFFVLVFATIAIQTIASLL